MSIALMELKDLTHVTLIGGNNAWDKGLGWVIGGQENYSEQRPRIKNSDRFSYRMMISSM